MAAPRQKEMNDRATVVATTTFAVVAVRCSGSDIAAFMIAPLDNEVMRQVAVEICERLRSHGHLAYFVGGCVRDTLLGIEPSDYDVATSATPDVVLSLFEGAQAVGAHFGVVLWHGVEIATFRSDGEYWDARHPSTVTFETTPKRDAMRRDFTINAMFMDPSTGEILDYHGGQEDLRTRVLTTVGSPYKRLKEDRLRVLRAVRFAAQFEMNIDGALFDAMREYAEELDEISIERIRDEYTKILTEGHAKTGFYWLSAIGLNPISEEVSNMLGAMNQPSLELALAVWLHAETDPEAELRRLRYPNAVVETVTSIARELPRFDGVRAMPRRELIRFARQPFFADLLELHRLRGGAEVDFCREAMQQELWPAPLINGEDVMAAGVPEGPEVGRLLRRVEDAQLDRQITTKDEALALILGC